MNGPDGRSGTARERRPGGADVEHVDVLVVGAGQAGLGTAYWLRRLGITDVLVVDAAPLGRSWLDRWDSLQLFTPRRFSGLPGLPFPSGSTRSPSRTEMAAYLQRYADHFDLPVRSGVTVQRLSGCSGDFTIESSAGRIAARQVVVASGPFRRPHVPEAAAGLSAEVHQLHSMKYRRPHDVPSGPVLVVGGGNSAAQLALELAATHDVTVASPGAPWFLPEDVLGVSMYWWSLLTGVLNARSTSWVSRYIRRRGDAIVGRQLREQVERGRVRLHSSHVASADGTTVSLADGTALPVASVLWCTGFRPDTDWVQVPGALDETGAPLHDRGQSPVPGLHWMGLPWQTRLNSSIIDGVDRDARATAHRIRDGLTVGSTGLSGRRGRAAS
jgi:putative flavoprotein involved in K+ transport